MASCDSSNEENINAIEHYLKKLNLSSDLLKDHSSENAVKKEVDTELVNSTFSFTCCSKSDILEAIITKSEPLTVIQLTNAHLLNNFTTNSTIKDEPQENPEENIDFSTKSEPSTVIQLTNAHLLNNFTTNSTIKDEPQENPEENIDFLKLLSGLTLQSTTSSDNETDDEANETIQKRGKCSKQRSNSRAENHSPYVNNHRPSSEFLQNNQLHLLGGSVTYFPTADETHSLIVNPDVTEEISNEQSPNSTPDWGRCTSPDSGYGSPASISNCMPSALPDSSDVYLKTLENVLNGGETISDDEKNDVLEDIEQMISKEMNNSKCDCQSVVKVIQPIYVMLVNSRPFIKGIPVQTKQLRRVLPKSSEYVDADNSRRNILKCHLDLNKIYHITANMFSQKRKDEKRKIIFVEDLKTKRTNLHLAVISEDLELTYSIVETQLQFKNEWKDVTASFNLIDSTRKSALDYAMETRLEHKSSLISYLETVGAKSKLKKKKK